MSPLDGYGKAPDLGPVSHALARRVREGALDADPVQRDLAARLDALGNRLRAGALERKGSALGWLFGRAKREPAPRGLYIHGEVGRGKSMLMDLFFETLPGAVPKRRLHFHEFMGDVQGRIARHRALVKSGEAQGDDPIAPTAEAIAAETRLLCFDEFTVTDIADAMILSRLFTALFAQGVVLVATSNVAPDDLYRDGLNRPLFLPFVDTLKAHTDVFLLDAPTDYRMEAENEGETYLTPLGDKTAARMDAAWRRLVGEAAHGPDEVRLRGRGIAVPEAGAGAARFGFAALIEAPLGAADYLALAARYHTIFLDGVPVMGDGERNSAKRFILLVDTLYDARRRLVLSAQAPADALYAGRSGTERFEFSRTISRLNEMGSADYLAEATRRRGAGSEDASSP